jgi:signal transduction histidine kinase
MVARLRKLDRLKSDFVTTVSHDLKSPLASLRETTSLLLDEIPGPLCDAQRRVLLLQRESADRLGRMIAKLLDLSRLEAGIPLVMHRIDVGEFVALAISHANAAARLRSVHVRLANPVPDGLVLEGDEEWLRQLLDNLLENAIKFSPAHEVAEVSVQASNGRMLLCVLDRGPGVDAAESDRIFDQFYQAAAGRSAASRGAGLGLAICRRVVERHGGRIGVLPLQGGNRFWFTLSAE